MRAPPSFWARDRGRTPWAAALLAPLGRFYGRMVARRFARVTPTRAAVPVVCAGNVTMGGVGKTPFVELLCRALTDLGREPVILMRGYGGRLEGPVRVTEDHTVAEVGDEATMLARRWKVIVSKDRPAGATLAVEEGADVIVMDDGFQNPTLGKDLSFVLVDGEAPYGNGHIFPAGPMREPKEQAFARADAVVIVNDAHVDPASLGIPKDMPIFRARLESEVDRALLESVVHVFSGIGRPEKFFENVSRKGIIITRTSAFPDHYQFTEADLRVLKANAHQEGALLATTEKDAVRLTPEDAEGIVVVGVKMRVGNHEGLSHRLSALFDREDDPS